MSLVTEDGTGLVTAESFASVATADAYFAARGNDAWAGLAESSREAALRRATDYMSAVFGPLWRSERKTSAQALDWPRLGWAGVPTQVEHACIELAVRASAGPLIVDEGPQVASERVGPVAVAYAEGSRQNVRYALVWALLGPLLKYHMIVARA